MNPKQPPQFESSPLTTNALLSGQQGALAVTLIPATGQLDWIVPTALILAVIPFDPKAVIHSQHYQWQQQVINTYSLLPKSAIAEHLVILEGESDDARVGLLIEGELRQRDIKLSDIKDIESEQANKISNAGEYALQLVSVQQQVYAVPDLSALSQQLL